MSTEENQLYEQELKQLVKLVFDKARKDSMETTKTGLSKHIETELNSQINHRTLIRYYNQFILGENEEMNHNRSGFDIISGYLGYRNFAEFCKVVFPETDIQETKEDFKQESAQGWSKFVPKLNFTQKATGIGILAAAGLGSHFGGDLMNQPECMYWTGVNYEMIKCDEVVHPNTLIIPVNPQLLQHMHKLEVSDTTTFFEADKPIVWYLKTDGKIEFYSAPGNHPVNGKPLKPITDYMINKYVKKAEN